MWVVCVLSAGAIACFGVLVLMLGRALQGWEMANASIRKLVRECEELKGRCATCCDARVPQRIRDLTRRSGEDC